MADVTMSDRDVQDLGAFRHLFGSPGDAAKKSREFEDDNAKLREKVRELTEKVKAVPADGTVVLSGEDATAYAAWKALDVKPEDVAKLKDERDALAAKDAERSRKDTFAEVAKALRWPEETAATLLDMKTLDGAAVEFKTEKVRDPKTGKDEDAQVPYVTLAGDGQKQQKFSEFATATPQLKGIRTDAVSTTTETSRAAPEQYGGGGSGPTQGTGIDALIAANQAATKAGNPLKPAKAAA